MDSNLQSPAHDNTDTKNAFRKPSGDSSHRNYRRHSPADGLPSSDGSPKHDRSTDPNPSGGGSGNVSDNHARKDDGREEERDYGKNHHGRSSDSFRHSDRLSSRSSYGHSRNEEYNRYDKYADEDRYHERLSSRSGLESRGDHTREGSDNRSKDHLRAVDKYSRDKYDRSEYRGSDYRSKEKDRETYSEHLKYKGKDSLYDRSRSGRKHSPYDDVERERRSRDSDYRDERRDSHRSYRDYRSDRAVSYSESRSQRDDPGSRKDSAKYRLKEAYVSEQKELDSKRFGRDSQISEDLDRNTRKTGEQINNEDRESSAKKTKLFGTEYDESQTSSSKHPQESNVNLGTTQGSGSEFANDLNSAKVAAMKAAELVNKNLAGAGCLTTDQKKKLLWGSKKNTPAEESGHRWDTALFSDRERQEKFNKLMGVKGDPQVEQRSNDQNVEKQREQLQMDLEKQYTAGLRRRDGRTVGLGL
ncbi:arginine/serine-rich coiled-coil protein 2 isoform X2 [Neltuma alba]|uniref:arginine/serine-rich coiled-coil protein 2 isoform X2 n=1 Tax=Neltuma alba TaxID=207710 RepID=UPI0010A31625|nr:arginine/serine-rich coiled-coil protein 2-like isoform X2 [Prosopis alba]